MTKKKKKATDTGRVDRSHYCGCKIDFTEENKQAIIHHYVESKWSLKKIAGLANVAVPSVRNHLRKWGIPIRPVEETRSAKREAHSKWNGGRCISKGGYVLIYFPEHPRSNAKYVPEHRLVLERHLQQNDRSNPALDKDGLLSRNWIVHHRNGIKDDNRIENLLPLQHGNHSPHMQCKEQIELLRKEVDSLRRMVVDLTIMLANSSFASNYYATLIAAPKN